MHAELWAHLQGVRCRLGSISVCIIIRGSRGVATCPKCFQRARLCLGHKHIALQRERGGGRDAMIQSLSRL